MSLRDHARAARHLSAAFANRADQMGDPTGILTCTAEAYADAAEMMEDEARADIEAIGGGCTIDHSGLKGSQKCLACGAGKS